MKTTIPTEILTAEDVTKFITELESNGEFFNFDDSPSEVINGRTGKRLFTDEEAVAVDIARRKCFEVCDVWELPVVLKIVFGDAEYVNDFFGEFISDTIGEDLDFSMEEGDDENAFYVCVSGESEGRFGYDSEDDAIHDIDIAKRLNPNNEE